MGNKLNHPMERVNSFGNRWFTLIHEAHGWIGIDLDSEENVAASEKRDDLWFKLIQAAHGWIGINLDFEENVAAGEKTVEVCHYNLRGRCSWGSKCRDIHCDLPYQWRWRRRRSLFWAVYSEEENDRIERAYCDPTNEKYTVLKHGMTIDFNSMSGKDNSGYIFEIERISTPSSVNYGKQTWRTNWLWYWKNPKGDWIKFGDLDDYEGCTAGIKSDELEDAFVDDPTGEANFKTKGTHSFDYIANFRNMTQRNSTYNTTRELRRRPEFINKIDFELNHLRVRNANNSMSRGIIAPKNWRITEQKDLSEHIMIVKVDESDSEYGDIKSLFFQSLQNVKIKSIDRIENGDLWENYMMKTSKMLKKQNGKLPGEKRVFHGTKDKYISAICNQGFDFRLNGQTSGTAYGKGCYFATNSSYSDSYAEAGPDKSMFVAKILPGEYVRGNISYCRPPHKDESDQTSDLYDSCVDDEEDPEIFVIFDNNQIYPEYLIRYTDE